LTPRNAFTQNIRTMDPVHLALSFSPGKAFKTYSQVSAAYDRIMKKLGVPFLKVEADTGNIGGIFSVQPLVWCDEVTWYLGIDCKGSLSHEYHIPCEGGDDTLLSCSSATGSRSARPCSYAANVEKAAGGCRSLTGKDLQDTLDNLKVTIHNDITRLGLSRFSCDSN
jgi:prolyl-tRNA synthetase